MVFGDLQSFDVDLPEPRAIATYTDITSQVADADRQRYRASHDSLTGLLNHDGLLERLDTQLTASDAANTAMTVHFLDLDRFKMINDSLGHGYGDQVLRVVAQRLTAAAGPQSSVGRIGGDEFSILSPAGSDPASARRQAEDLLAAITSAPIDTGTSSVRMTASVGSVTTRRNEDRSGRDLLSDADIALYYAKQSGRARSAVYDVSLRREFQARQQLEQDLRAAIDAPSGGQLANRYQLIFDTATRQVVGVEATLRWKHPTHGDIDPGDFLPLADHLGLGDGLGHLSFDFALTDLGEVLGHRPGRLTLGITLSRRQSSDNTLLRGIESAIGRGAISARDLRLGVADAVFAADDYPYGPPPMEQLSRLRDLGVSVAIDDFGAGHFSLAQLHQADAVRIAPAVIDNLATSEVADAALEGIVAVARAAGMTVIATGVVTADQFAAITRFGCHQAQGPYLHSPEPAAAVESRLT